jgi:hypothetical protein
VDPSSLDEIRRANFPAIGPNVVSEEEIEVIELLGRPQASTARVSKAVGKGRMRLIAPARKVSYEVTS